MDICGQPGINLVISSGLLLLDLAVLQVWACHEILAHWFDDQSAFRQTDEDIFFYENRSHRLSIAISNF